MRYRNEWVRNAPGGISRGSVRVGCLWGVRGVRPGADRESDDLGGGAPPLGWPIIPFYLLFKKIFKCLKIFLNFLKFLQSFLKFSQTLLNFLKVTHFYSVLTLNKYLYHSNSSFQSIFTGVHYFLKSQYSLQKLIKKFQILHKFSHDFVKFDKIPQRILW